MPDLLKNPLHLGLGATAIVQPTFTGMDWYQGYGERHDGDGAEGRLVTMYRFTESWDSWEMHPAGDEVVLCLSGHMTLHQEHADGRTASVTLGPKEYAVNPPGTWHTADVDGEATALFITAGLGTRTPAALKRDIRHAPDERHSVRKDCDPRVANIWGHPSPYTGLSASTPAKPALGGGQICVSESEFRVNSIPVWLLPPASCKTSVW